jgi:2-polyprenyl-3-methyl-5-hydroxy-6-metoxy-1,4-benzoquinol methylase
VQPRVNDEADPKGEELAAVVEEIRSRVRARYPSGTVVGGVPLPDLLPLLHARDAAEGKVAAIGTVNPRARGLVNSTVQFFKRLVSRALDWHVREQVEFNRAAAACVQATLDTFGEYNRAFVDLAAKIDAQAREIEELRGQGSAVEAHLSAVKQEFGDTRSHWNQWREGWQQKLSANEIHFLRSVSELQAAFQHRVTLLEQDYKELVRLQHSDFENSLRRAGDDIQKRLWDDLDRIRTEYETIIHAEIRMLRQKAALARDGGAGTQAAKAPLASELARLDWLKFGEKFRGGEEYVKRRQRMYADRFVGQTAVLDIGCGRGEMLEVLKEACIEARGIDLSDESAVLCRGKGLTAERADLFEYLDAQPDGSLGGIVCSQVVEHLPPERIPELVRLAHAKIRPDGLLAIETPNPECLAIFATHFYLDPTHTRPIPPPLLAFYLEEAGFGRIETERLYPAIDTMPSLASLPEDFRKEFFGSLDYAIFARKLLVS